MKIQPTINKFIFTAPYSKASKIRAEMLEKLEESGCKIIRERLVGCDSRVLLGYKNEFSDLANYAVRISKDGSYEYKFSEALYSPIPSSKKTYSIRRFVVDKDGNTDIETRNYAVIDRHTLMNYTKRTSYENYQGK